MTDTRQRILDVARQLFNDQGLNQVSVRDVARAAGLTQGNLAYHFPTRDDLVAALLDELYQLTKLVIFSEPMESFSLVSLYHAAMGAMQNMLAYRFVLLSYVDAVRASPRLAELERELATRRRKRHDVMLAALVDNGFLERAALARSETLYEQGMMISSGWLAAATLRGWSDERAVLHFAKLGCALLEPHGTDKGKRQLRRIARGELDSPHDVRE